ncbi:aminotransferase class V-fold PLP-dependent enzyme [Microcella humidisoli]|uniref:Aminotransferase class V-fold PLP-dependent enzyme n=1 Tax=Microcella humidisoli TaxID=2963406 RepID=A0ABY5FYG9_9MICO|nr:aminotransferase class V-fold PLP-dependent enzyme [Microcella humidisoli]UTT62915.1 aminotransferase class V-fold PLP-dependent enzyme [Microcella humidisoli]
MSASMDAFVAGFSEEPGYLNHPRLSPIGEHALAEERAMADVLSHARFGSFATLEEQDDRVRTAVAALVRTRPDQVVFQPSTSQALMHVMFGLTGGVAASTGEFPAVGYAMARAAQSLGVLVPHAITPEHERVTPGVVRDQLASSVVAVVVSLVDYRTGHLVDLEGIRQVIGDRLLIVDAIQGAGIVDAPWELADVIASGGQKWLRAGQGTGFLALSDRAREQLTPVWSGWLAHGGPDLLHDVVEPASDAGAFRVGYADAFAQARLAGAVDAVMAAGVPSIRAVVEERTARIMEIADEAGIEVASPREDAERAGIVVLEPHPEFVSALAAALHNHGVSATVRGGRVRLGAHVSTDDTTLEMLRAALGEFSTTTSA